LHIHLEDSHKNAELVQERLKEEGVVCESRALKYAKFCLGNRERRIRSDLRRSCGCHGIVAFPGFVLGIPFLNGLLSGMIPADAG
jgi:hypothetical protein